MCKEKPIPWNKWVWQLQETKEEAHRIVRDDTKGEMMRQKRYHDRKLQWQIFLSVILFMCISRANVWALRPNRRVYGKNHEVL